MQSTSLKAATNAERRRWSWFIQVGCIACRKLGIQNPQAEVHHLLSGGRRRGHLETVPLCPWHHRKVDTGGWDYGPALPDGRRAFEEAFGSDDELLAETNAEIAKLEATLVGREFNER